MKMKSDHRSKFFFQFKQLERRSLKKSGLQRDSNPWPPAFSRKLKDRFSPPLLQCCLRCTLGLLSQLKQHCTRGIRGEGANLFLLDTDGCMEQNWKLHWNASTLLSGVVNFFVVVLKRAVFNGSTKNSFKIFLNFTYEEEFTVSLTSFWFYWAIDRGPIVCEVSTEITTVEYRTLEPSFFRTSR